MTIAFTQLTYWKVVGLLKTWYSTIRPLQVMRLNFTLISHWNQQSVNRHWWLMISKRKSNQENHHFHYNENRSFDSTRSKEQAIAGNTTIASPILTDHRIDLDADRRTEVTWNTVEFDFTRNLKSAEDHWILCRDSSRGSHVDTVAEYDDEMMNWSVWSSNKERFQLKYLC